MELLKKIFQEAQQDRLTAEAAKAAYYFFLSFFPTILALFALTGIFGGDSAIAEGGEVAATLEQERAHRSNDRRNHVES